MASTINASTVSGIVQSADTSGVLALQTGGTTALTVTTGQNVNIGATAGTQPSRLNVVDTLAITNSAGGQRILIGNQDSGGTNLPRIISCGNAALSFGTGDSWSSSIGGTLTNQLTIQYDGTLSNCITNNGTLYPAYFARAFVAVNQQGTQAIKSSGNVSSISDGGTGLTTVNLATAMPDANYCVANGISGSGVISGVCLEINVSTSSQFQLRSLSTASPTAYDMPYVTAIVMR